MSKFIVFGGAGFIGCNTVHRLMKDGHEVVIADDLSRRGVTANLDWLREHGDVQFEKVDIRDEKAVDDLFAQHGDVDTVIHLAGQTAVTTSIERPREDFEINAAGTLNILESLRAAKITPLLIYASTNKVYGGMEQIVTEERETRYVYRDYPEGIPETATLDFHSPYGCSKGVADQYVRDYHRIYGLPTVVMRQSCIYGYRQFGVADQGWMAWFIIAAILERPVTIYGDGKQVRDVLFIDDLVDAYLLAAENRDVVAGKIYNVGGGPGLTMSIWAEFGAMLEELVGHAIPVTYREWRPGDQPIYISDIRKIGKELGWSPKTSMRDGIQKVIQWVEENKDLFRKHLG